MAIIGPIEDRLAIRELYSSYGAASAWADGEAFLDCWTEDGVWNTQLFNCTGKAELRAQREQLWQAFEKVAFVGDVASTEVNGDTAVARSIAREIILLKAGGVYKLAGRYEDRLVRHDGRWRFARRDYTPLVEELPG